MTTAGMPVSGAPISTADLAVDRTALAHDRTLMAWTRTATSMVGFAFTIYKLFHELEIAHPERWRALGAREVALALCAVGTITLLLGMLQYRQAMKVLTPIGRAARFRPPLFVAGFIALFGIVTFLMALVRA
jgi:putative membrane protein